jgi:tRNA (guanine37-N1)-methyltransferase
LAAYIILFGKTMFRIDVLTLFPEMFKSILTSSILKRAIEKKVVKVHLHDIRDYAIDKHRQCDDKPFGGGPGMVMKPEPIDRLAKKILRNKAKGETSFIYLTPQGKPLTQATAKRLAQKKRIVLLCGHYEGVDERIIDTWVTEEISIGDYVLTGGELPAMVLIDSMMRLLPGALGNKDSTTEETFDNDLLEYPQYTRPAEFKKQCVPEVLLSGNHKAIAEWRKEASLKRTKIKRPDLIDRRNKSKS